MREAHFWSAAALLIDGFRPYVGDTFHILNAAAVSGNFSTINSPGFIVRSDVSATDIVLTITGLDPLLRIISIARGGNDILIICDATAGKSYRLEEGALDGNWDPVPGVLDQTPAANGPALFIHSGGASSGRGFYRVRLLP